MATRLQTFQNTIDEVSPSSMAPIANGATGATEPVKSKKPKGLIITSVMAGLFFKDLDGAEYNYKCTND